ncbi:aldehyde dehydrogenase family protein [Bacteroidota bacterium]
MAKTDEIMDRARQAAAEFKKLNQDQIDKILRAVYLAAMDNRIKLAKMAVEETQLGIWEDKVEKNIIAGLVVYESIKNEKTVGVISEDDQTGIIEMAQPIGPILGLIPVINPTSTAIYKILISMKTRNPIIISSTFASKNCVAETAKICYDAALNAGAPEHCIQWLTKPNLMKTKEIMSHRKLALILATGTGEMVKTSYSSGTPTIGVGAGNVPVYIGATADVPFAIENIMKSKTFDNGSICASEQSIVVKKEMAGKVISEFQKHNAYFLSKEEIGKINKIAYDQERGLMSAAVVGQSVQVIAEKAGINVPKETTLLIAQLDRVSRDCPMSAEILAPLLAFYVEEDFESAIERCVEITHFGGIGHTAVIYSNDPERIEYFSQKVEVARILVNTPSTQGALGGMYNTLEPSFTLSCGTGGKNNTTDNISVRHLLNIHRICRRRLNQRWINLDKNKYLSDDYTAEDIENEFYKNT